MKRCRKIYLQVFITLSIVGAVLPAVAGDSPNLSTPVYVNSKDLG